MLGLQIIVVLLIALWTYFLWSRRKYYALGFKMPCEWGLPIIGSGHKIYKIEEILLKLPELALKNKTKTLFFWLGPYPVIYVTDPKIAEQVLISPSCSNKSRLYDSLREALGDGLVTSNSPRWNHHRKLINPCFSNSVLRSFIPLFNRLSRGLCDKLDTHLDCGEINVKELVVETTILSSIATTMGLDNRDGSVDLFKTHFETLAAVARLTFQPWMHVPKPLQRTKFFKTFAESLKILKGAVYELIQNKFQLLDQNVKELRLEHKSSSSDDIKKVSHIFIDKLLNVHQKNELTLEDLTTEANIMVMAAFDTTATTLFSVLMFLAMFPEYQEKAYEEITSVLPDEECEVRQEDIKNLVYLSMCIKEALRVAQAIPFIGRVASADVRISDDLEIPKGTDIIVDIFNMHRDEGVWGPKAKAFDPDHFLPENLADKDKGSFMPFSAGPRNCIGWQYADIFLNIALSTVLRRYRFSTTFPFEDLRFEEHIVLKLKTVPKLSVQRR